MKTVNDTHTAFVYDGWNMIAERSTNSSQQTTNYYVWGLDLSGTMQGAGGIGGLLAITTDDGTYFPTLDANGNITDYIDTNGTTVAHYEYGPFGGTIASSGTKKDDFVHRFSTKYLDTETEFYYYGYRYYNPELGRWPSRDPIGEEGFQNHNIYDVKADCTLISMVIEISYYGSCYNDLINLYDKFGLAAAGGIRCKGGKFVGVIWPNLPPKLNQQLSKAVSDCLQQHEDSHAADFERRYPKWCANKKDGTKPPRSGRGYNKFHAQSECDAYHISYKCLMKINISCLKQAEKNWLHRNVLRHAQKTTCWCRLANEKDPKLSKCSK